MMYELNEPRNEYLCSLFKNNQYVLLDWPRNIGKSIHAMAILFQYAMNHPNSNILAIGEDSRSYQTLKDKIISCRKPEFFKNMEKQTKYKLILTNGSVIDFDHRNKSHLNLYDVILLDDVQFKIKNDHDLFNNLASNQKIKVLMTCTDFVQLPMNSLTLYLSSICKDLVIEPFKTDEDLLPYLRRKKIEQIKNRCSKTTVQ